METEKFRIESDLLGSKEVPTDALYGVQTVRAIENFDISGHLMSEYPNFIKGMAITKKAAAIANYEVGMIDIQQRDAICTACDELLEGKHHDQFPIDMIQGGAGTSTNMCANEVIANRALELMGHKRGDYKYCSPNDIVNASQSTNDAYPCSIHLAMVLEHEEFLLHLVNMIGALDKKAEEFKDVIKMGRTQLQDAVPMTLGQTFSGFAASLRGELKTLNMAAREFLVVNMGATAIGTGICSKPGYSGAVINALRRVTGWNITLADNGQLELNVMEPVIAYCLFESIHLLTNGLDTLRTHCIEGIEANVEHCRKMVENSIGIVTMLNPIIGYKESTKIAKEASETGRGVYELVLEHGILTKEQLDWILRPENMIKPVEIKF